MVDAAVAMDSICDGVDLAIAEVRGQSAAIDRDLVFEMRVYLSMFEEKFRCMRIFVDCISKWTDIADVLHLASLVGKVEDKIRGIASEFLENINIELPLQGQGPPPPSGFPILEFLQKKKNERSLELKISRLVYLFRYLGNQIMYFTP